MSDTFTTLLTTAGGAYLGKFVGPAAEAMGKAAWERAQQVGAKATALLTTVGREPQPVEPKLLVPLVQAAALESDPTLAEKWAALLANAADPAQRVAVQSGFIEVLRQLTPDEAQVLTMLYAPVTKPDSQPVISGFKTEALLESLGLDYNDVSLIVDNLMRLQLCFGERIQSVPMPYNIGSTTYGHYFMKAVTSPRA
jgi:hypothetical protein